MSHLNNSSLTLDPEIQYPESDGQPMADNTKQFYWIVTIKENLEILFAQNPNVFIAGNLYWFPVQNHPKIKQAPDILAVFGRPKGDRSSYMQWEEENIPMQVVFEILSPSNKPQEMANKFKFYERYGVEEYYIYDPQKNRLEGFFRRGKQLQPIVQINNWTSPRLGIRFQLTPETLEIYRADGRKFLTSVELEQLREQEAQRAEQLNNQLINCALNLLQNGMSPEQVAQMTELPLSQVQELENR